MREGPLRTASVLWGPLGRALCCGTHSAHVGPCYSAPTSPNVDPGPSSKGLPCSWRTLMAQHGAWCTECAQEVLNRSGVFRF